MITTNKQLKEVMYAKRAFSHSFGPNTSETYREVYETHYKQIGNQGFYDMFVNYHFGFRKESGIQIAKYVYQNDEESFISVELEPTFEEFNPLQPTLKGIKPKNVKVNYVLYSVYERYKELITTIPVGEEDKLLFWLEGSFVATKRKFERYEKMEADRNPKRKRNRSSQPNRLKTNKCLSLATV